MANKKRNRKKEEDKEKPKARQEEKLDKYKDEVLKMRQETKKFIEGFKSDVEKKKKSFELFAQKLRKKSSAKQQ